MPIEGFDPYEGLRSFGSPLEQWFELLMQLAAVVREGVFDAR